MENINISKNESVVNIICLYCEWYDMKQTEDLQKINQIVTEWNNTLPIKLKEIKEKINNYYRIEIVGKFFNPASGEIEYKLENGKYIPINGKTEYELSYNEKIELFGIDFIKEIEPVEFRDGQIDKIL